jgi:hypothetical protein
MRKSAGVVATALLRGHTTPSQRESVLGIELSTLINLLNCFNRIVSDAWLDQTAAFIQTDRIDGSLWKISHGVA